MMVYSGCCTGLVYIFRLPNVEPRYIPVPLRSVRVEGKIVDMVAEVVVTQEYENRESIPIEATYVFPLDEKSAVFEFSAEVDGRVVKGVVRPKEVARAEYQEAVDRGQSAYLLEESRADVFQVSVGNLQPGKTARISVSYVTELALEGDKIKFVLPTAVAPRYSPANETDPIPSVTYTAGKTPYKLKLDLLLEMPLGIAGVTSPTHAVTYKRQTDHIGEVGFLFETASMDRDFVLLVATPSAQEHRAVFESDGTDTAAMVTLVPRFQLDDVKTEVIFVIDRSGSMEGSQIAQAASALRIFLRSLPPDCYLNIVGFGSSYQFLFKNSVKYDDNSMSTATRHAESLAADLGGTELLQPLRDILKRSPIKGYPRQVFVLTDGQISNTDEVIKLVESHKDTTRVFALGIGASVSRHLVEGLARAGNGTAQFVVDGESMEAKVMRQLKHAIQPALTRVRIDWGENVQPTPAPAEVPPPETGKKSLLGYRKPSVPKASPAPPPSWSMQAPFIAPPVFDGERFICYCVFKGVRKAPATVKLVAESPDGPLEAELTVTEDNCFEGQTVHRLAARALIRDLEEERSYMHKAEGVAAPTPAAVDAEVERLAIKYSLASRRTAFVAIDPARPAETLWCHYGPVLREVPVMQAQSLALSGLVSTTAALGSVHSAQKFSSSSRKKSAGFSMPSLSMPRFFGGGGGGAAPQSRAAPMAAPMPARMAAPPMAAAAPPPPGGYYDDKSMAKKERECAPCLDECEDMSVAFEGLASAMPAPAAQPARRASVDAFSAIVSAQKFDGSFGASFLSAIGTSTAAVDAAYAGSGATTREQWITAVAIAFMEVRLASRHDEWELMSNKAAKWLRTKSGCANADGVLAAARAFVSSI